MSEDIEQPDLPAEAPAESADGFDYMAALARLEREYDSERPSGTPEGSAQDDTEQPDFEAQAEVPNLSSADWNSIGNTFDTLTDYVLKAEDRRLVDASLRRIRESFDLALSNENMERLARKMVEDNPAWLDAWRNQESDPISWKNIENRVGRELAREFTRHEHVPTSDIEAVEASVRGQTAETPRKQLDVTGVGNMSNAQYERWKREHVGS